MPFDPVLLALTPLQVVVHSNSTMKNPKPKNLTSDHKSLLLLSVARFLEANGFSKTLKKFLSEADIQINALKGCTNLEEIYIKYIEIGDESESKKKDQDKNVVGDEDVKKLGLQQQQQTEASYKNEKEKDEKRRKKNISSESESVLNATVEKSKEVNAEKKPSTDNVEQKPEESSKNEKKKKKKKNDLSSVPESVSEANKEKSEDVIVEKSVACENVETPVEKEKGSKSKSKKRKNDESADASANGNSNAMDEDSKGSKKRKREVPDQSDLKLAEKIDAEESKGRKVTETTENQVNGSENENMDKTTQNLAFQKSGKKQLNGSAEPKTVNAFQRVKVEEVVFTDERFKDNSYWAKSGADTGYGAKAEEVLGQVRGRDFRHEKTKKKRGSYRGGQIDLQSHSIKFNYSDDE